MPKTAKEKLKTENTIRPPVVVIMGHVDHGKTTLLDFIRKSRVAEKEAGGITQHIGAYSIAEPKPTTFIDTPGHEAFSEMRSRGAKVADIGVLVVAADEGVKPQTKEAIAILKSANIPFIVAMNKIDRPGKDVERVKKELAENDVLVESWGGKVPSVEISAKTGEGVDGLLELIGLVAEVSELKGDAARPAEAVVIESHRDAKRGATATLIIRDGSLKRGDFLAADGSVSAVKILEDFLGKPIPSAGPSVPVRVAGLVTVPAVGAPARVFSERSPAEEWAKNEKKEAAAGPAEETEGKQFINVVLKADVSGSREAIEGVLNSMQLSDVGIRLIRSEVGDVNDSDIQLALSSRNVVIISFKVKFPDYLTQRLSDSNVILIQSEIIYELFDQLKEAIKHLIPAEIREVKVGSVRILKFFKQEKSKQIIGGRVTEGHAETGAYFRVNRKDVIQGKGRIVQLQQRKQAVREIPEGSECGLMVEADMLIAENDVLEIFKEERVERSF